MAKVELTLGEVTVAFPKVEGSLIAKPAQFPVSVLAGLIAFGIKEKLNNACSAIKSEDFTDDAAFAAKIEETCAAQLAAMESGEIRFGGGGGGSVSALERACRNVWQARKVAGGMKPSDAAKAAPSWRALVAEAAAQRAEASGEDASDIAARTIAWIEGEAEKMLKRAHAVDIDVAI